MVVGAYERTEEAQLRPTMDGHAWLAAAPLHIEAQLEPGKLANTRRCPSLGVSDAHVLCSSEGAMTSWSK